MPKKPSSKSKVSSLYLERLKDLVGITKHKFPKKSPKRSDVEAVRQLHREVFGRKIKIKTTKKIYDQQLRKLVEVPDEYIRYEPGILSWDARDPKVRKEKYLIKTYKEPKKIKKLQEIVGQGNIHKYFDVAVFPKRTIGQQEFGAKILKLPNGVQVVTYGFVAEIVIPVPDDFDRDDDEESMMDLMDTAEEYAKEITAQLRSLGYLAGPPIYMLMAGPHPMRATGTQIPNDLLDQHDKLKARYNRRKEEEDRYSTWFSGIKINIPYGLMDDFRIEGIMQIDKMKQDQIRRSRERRKERQKRIALKYRKPHKQG